MQIERPKIQLYKVRSFGDKFSDTFDFLKENSKLWLKGCLYLLLPLSLLQAFSLNYLTSTFSDMAVNEEVNIGDSLVVKLIISYVSYFIFILIGSILLAAFTYAMMRHYHENDERLRGVTLKDLKPKIIKAAKRSLIMGLTLGTIVLLLYAVFGLIVYITEWWGIVLLLILLAVAAIVPLSLAYPIYIFEDSQTVFSSLRQSIMLTAHHFWAILGFLLVLNILANVIQGCFMLPWYIMFLVKTLFVVSDNENPIVNSSIFSFALYLFAVIQTFGMYLSMSLNTIGLGYQYGSLAEEMDDVSVDEDIQRFEEMSAKSKEIDNFEDLV